MIITCEECGVKFNLNEAVLKPVGSKVRCSKCKHIFTAYPPPPAESIEKSPKAEPDLSEDLKFSDLERMLEEPAPTEAVPKTSGSEFQMEESEIEIETKEEELDLSGLDDMLSEKKEDAVDDHGDDDDMELDLDLESDEILDDISLEVEGETGDVDFSELDGILEPDEKKADTDLADEMDLALELELDEGKVQAQGETAAEQDEFNLDIDLELEPKEEKKESASDDLELELELEPDKEEKESPKELDLELELDIDEGISRLTMEDGSDTTKSQETIEQDLLATKSLVDADKEGSDELELELDIDESIEEKAVEADASEEEIDLSELEQTLEMELLTPNDEADEEPENVELELSDDQEELTVETESAGDEEIDVSDIEEMLDMGEEEVGEGETTGTDDLELEFDIDSHSGAADDEAGSKAIKPPAAFEESADAEAKSISLEKDVVPLEEKKHGKPIVIIAILMILLGVAVGGYILMASLGILPSIDKMNIPFISNILKSSEKLDMGKIEVVQSSINHDWIRERKLFFITGRVKNNSSKTHHSIQVKADLYSKGKVLTKTVAVYCGNALSNEELRTLAQEEIDKRLANQFVSDNQYIKLPAGGELPFIIVIPNLTDDMEEYKVLVSGSTAE